MKFNLLNTLEKLANLRKKKTSYHQIIANLRIKPSGLTIQNKSKRQKKIVMRYPLIWSGRQGTYIKNTVI